MNGENEPRGGKGIPAPFWPIIIGVALVVLPFLAIATESDIIIGSVSILVVISIGLTVYFLTKPRNEGDKWKALGPTRKEPPSS